ncbi:MAG TPA: ABC transporter substrate-binding protein, partial [Dehalococcoidales bacterium]|nr:ABC transporter substrate-binding protein [Dehalococcoidales bacterium]
GERSSAMKRTLIVLGIVITLCMILTACGGTPATTPATTAPQTTAPQTTAPATTTTTPARTTTPTAPAVTTATPPVTMSTPRPTATPVQPQYGGTFKQALRVGPATPLGYPIEAAPDAQALAIHSLERLIRVKRGGFVEPLLATSWDIAGDGKSITFQLRKGVKFHDGTDFNAAAVKWNYDRVIEARRAPNYTSVDVLGEHTIRINLTGYQNTSLTTLSSGTFSIISPTSSERNGLAWTRLNPIGTGPFIFVQYDRDARLFFKRNPNYWDPGKPYLDGLQFDVIADETVRKLAFLKGDLHRLDISGLTARELLDLNYKYWAEPGGTFVLIPDSKNADSPWSNLKVRQAASHAINREALAKGLGFGLMKPAYQAYPGFEVAVLPNLVKHEFNPAKAKQLLAEAGYPNGFQTSIHTFLRVISRDYTTAVAKMLTDVGIRATPEFPEAGKYDEMRYGGWKNSLMAHGLASFDNFNTFFNFYFGAMSFPSVKTPAGFTEAVNATLNSKEFDPQLFRAVLKLMEDDLMYIPYVEEIVTSFYQKGVHDPGGEIIGRLAFISDLAWMEPSAR